MTGAYIDGSSAYKMDDAPAVKTRPERRKTSQRAAAPRASENIRARRSAGRARVRAVAAIASAAAVFVGLIIITLNAVIANNTLASEISDLEYRLEELTEQNDSKEYDINSSVDLNAIIKAATNQLGMIRGGTENIRYYSANDDEYVQQVAEIPNR